MSRFTRQLSVVLFIVLSSYLATPASAIIGPFQNDVPEQCPFWDPDVCMFWSGDGTGAPSSDNTCRSSSHCLACALDEARNREFCGYITMSASCECTIYKPEGSAANITACSEGGQCTFVY